MEGPKHKCYCCPDDAVLELVYSKPDGTLYEEHTFTCLEDSDAVMAVSNLVKVISLVKEG